MEILITSITISAILAIIFGILILIFPRLLNTLIGLYLIIIGVLQLFGSFLGLSPLI